MKNLSPKVYNASALGVKAVGYVLYCPGDSADHSREDWIRGTCALVPEEPDLISRDPEGDLRLGLGKISGLFRDYRWGRGDTVLMPCPQRGIRGTALGCSWEQVTGRHFKGQILVPDRRSLYLLRTMGLGKKVQLGPDPLFLVKRRVRSLSGAFRRDTVGLCFGASEEPAALFRQLIEYILMETTFEIALIPYHSGDIPLLSVLNRHYGESGRVWLRNDADSEQLRGDLSLCRCVVGGRGVMAAWSCGVPGLSLEYSGRIAGLATDLFGSWQNMVLTVEELRQPGGLVSRFREFLKEENNYRRQLEQTAPQRREFARQWPLAGH